jgi:hypothetical protein
VADAENHRISNRLALHRQLAQQRFKLVAIPEYHEK